MVCCYFSKLKPALSRKNVFDLIFRNPKITVSSQISKVVFVILIKVTQLILYYIEKLAFTLIQKKVTCQMLLLN